MLQVVPDIATDPQGWFRVVDRDANGRLDKKEVTQVTEASLIDLTDASKT